jgi:hypothetical protein
VGSENDPVDSHNLAYCIISANRGKNEQAQDSFIASCACLRMIEMIKTLSLGEMSCKSLICMGFLYKEVKEIHQPLYQKLVDSMRNNYGVDTI